MTDLEDTVRQLQREVAAIQAQLDALVALPPGQVQHSPEARAWAERHGIDLDEFVPYPDVAPGTYTMSVAEAAQQLQLSQEQIRRHLRSGRLHGVALGGRAGWRVSREGVARLRAEREGLLPVATGAAFHTA